MKARALYEAGRLDEAIETLGAELRDDPGDARRRTFLFELLCFAGEYDRAEKQLDVIAASGPQAQMGGLLYRSALHAARIREEMFESNSYPAGEAGPQTVSGTLNGQPFESLTDADPRLGARLELFAAGEYTWVPWSGVASLRIEAPRQLRDLLWAPASVEMGPGFESLELDDVLLPVTAPTSWAHTDGNVRLGRATAWFRDGDLEVPIGHKLLIVDGNEVPLLEVRELLVDPPA